MTNAIKSGKKKKWKNGRSIHLELAYKICQTHDERKKSIEICKAMLDNLTSDGADNCDYSKEVIPRSLLAATNAKNISVEQQVKELRRAIEAQQTLVAIVEYALIAATADTRSKKGELVAEQLKTALWASVGVERRTSVSRLAIPEGISLKAFKQKRFLLLNIVLSAFGGMPYTRDFSGYDYKAIKSKKGDNVHHEQIND